MKRINGNRRFEMSIHGVQPAVSESDEPVRAIELCEDKQRDVDAALKQARERKKMEFSNKG